MEINNPVVANAVAAQGAAKNAAGGSPFYRAYAERAKAALREIRYAAEGELRALRGYADSAASEARKAGDAEGWNEIVRRQAILEDALANYVRASLRTIG